MVLLGVRSGETRVFLQALRAFGSGWYYSDVRTGGF
jgi:hypothetical protein